MIHRLKLFENMTGNERTVRIQSESSERRRLYYWHKYAKRFFNFPEIGGVKEAELSDED